MSRSSSSRRRMAERRLERFEAQFALGTHPEVPDLDPEFPALFARGSVITEGATAQQILDDAATGGVSLTSTAQGARIVQIKTETFFGHINYVYWLDIDGTRVLWDTGSGREHSRSDIVLGLALAKARFGLPCDVADLDVVIISHGHIDHFGDVRWFVKQSGAKLWVHELDARVLEHFGERQVLHARDLRGWLSKAGVSAGRTDELVAMSLAGKALFSSDGVVVDRRLRHRQRLFEGRAHLVHTPGHCPGHLCMVVDDAVLVADQVLAPITPHISPQALQPHNGLSRYMYGLVRLRREEGIRHVFSAHYEAIDDLGARIDEIWGHHADMVQKVFALCKTGSTVVDVAKEMYGKKKGYHVLLAVLEAGAHVEYLHQVGAVGIANVDELVSRPDAPVVYRAYDTEAADPRPLVDGP